MLKIGEFSKLSLLTVKALRFYEKEGILKPAAIDRWTGYRLYETSQLEVAAKIKAFRELDLSIREIKSFLSGKDAKALLTAKANALRAQKDEIEKRLSRISFILSEDNMKYQVMIKIVPEHIVYYSEARLPSYSDMTTYIPAMGAEVIKHNPNLKCAEPSYEYCEYPEGEYKEKDILIRHNEAVVEFGVESENIKFRSVPETKVLSVFHKGPYDRLGEAYAFIMKYAAENGYRCAGLSRERYIDGIWNKESVEDWLTELQLPIE